MAKKLALVLLWFLATPIILAFSGFYLHHQTAKPNPGNLVSISNTPIKLENSVDGQVISSEINDIRPLIVSNFLKHTVLEPYSQYMIEIADKYDIDYRLIPAIAMKESGGGNAAPRSTFNAWGFENGKTAFNSWESAIDSVGKTLKVRYIAKGLVTPEQIMAVYAPPALLNGGGWARDINSYFSQMEAL